MELQHTHTINVPQQIVLALNKIDAELRETPLIIGFTPTGWRTITDVQIKKKIDKDEVDSMRCIQMVDPELNIANSQAGKEIFANAEAANVVEPE